MQEVIKKEDNIVRSESLAIHLLDEDAEEVKIIFESEDPENMQISVFDGKETQYIGMCDMPIFVALCKRAVELWEKETE